MPAKQYVVALSEEQRQKVQIVARSYKHSQREPKRAKNLLLADTHREDGGLRDGAICEPAQAKRLADKLDIHYTPKHGSWLNMAEIELWVLGRQCLDRRLPDVPQLKSEIAAWEQGRNAAERTVHWHFTTADARIKLKKLYPIILS